MEMKEKIAALEEEIAKKQAELKNMKAEMHPHLNFKKHTGIHVGSGDVILHAIRVLVSYVSTAHMQKALRHYHNSAEDPQYLCVSRHMPKISDMGKAKVDICNRMVDELAPVIEKYLSIFAETNGTKK
jgi:hypothetical protein